MLEYLYYYCGGYFGPNERLIIKQHNEGYDLDYCRYYQDYVDNGVPHFKGRWSKAYFNRWYQKLKIIGIERWKDKYWEDACDGEQWELRFKFENEEQRIISGDNAYPDNWEQFQRLMKTIAKRLPSVGFMTINQSARLFYGDFKNKETEVDQGWTSN